MKHPVGTTRNGKTVYANLIGSSAGKLIAQQPYLLGLIRESLRLSNVTGPVARVERDMGKAIGYNYVVETTDKDTILYACLTHDDVYTRFVKNGKPLSTQYLTMELRRDPDNDGYELHDAWLGRAYPPRPGSPDETSESKIFWANHAFVLDNQTIQSRTVTKTCPY